MAKLDQLLTQIRKCSICSEHLPLGPNPIVRADREARILLIGQAPGIRVHQSSVPWDDPSGDRLREWLAMDKDRFYSSEVAIVPMGFCYPGRGKSGDLAPRKECAEAWHEELTSELPNIQLTILIGLYAQQYYLPNCEPTLTATVKNFRSYLPKYLPLPHPSPRNNIWLKKNQWFEKEVLPTLQQAIIIK